MKVIDDAVLAMPYYKLKQPEKNLFGVLVLLGFCISNIYKCNLKAMLTAQKVDIPFETLEELVNNNDYTVYMQQATALLYIIQVSKSLHKLLKFALVRD